MPALVQCSRCGSMCSEQSAACSRCGAALATAPADLDVTRTMSAPVVAAAAQRQSQPLRTGSLSSTSSAEEEGRFVPGTLVAGRYRIIGLLGRGGMGEVYRATDLTLGQSVALKFLPEDAARDTRILERFHTEVRTARQVTHPNVCRVYDIGETEGHPFISMEYVDGEDLASLLQRIGRVPAGKALEITRKLCAGLAAAHDRGIMHRDLKPHNIMLNKRGDIVIMDFGLAALTDELHGHEARSGTPAYMAPEQLRGDSVTMKSDLYSLGLIAYELFTGRRAFEGETVLDLLRSEETIVPPSLTDIAPDVDRGVEDVILRCLQPDPKLRPPNARAIAAALPGGDPLAAALAAGEMPSPELVAASTRAQGMSLRYALACLVLVLVSIVGWPLFLQSMPQMALYSVAPMDFPAPVLEQKSREIAAGLGSSAKRTDWTSRFRNNGDLIDQLAKRRAGADWRTVFSAASPVEFWYRQSADYFAASPDGTVLLDRPPLTEPGMLAVVLDSRGRLRDYKAVAPRFPVGSAQSRTIDPAAVFTAAGLDIAKFHEVAPAYVPPLAFDARRAWTGPYPGLANTEVTVEVATWQGAVTSFFLRWPWTRTESAPPSRKLRDTVFTTFYVTLMGIGLACAAFFARRNLRLGRGDRTGARRVAGAGLLLNAMQSAAVIHVAPVFHMIGFVFERFAVSLLFAAILWLLYIALEPAVRARWPHTLITWNRLTAGDWRDPALNSHVLIGLAFGVAWVVLFVAHMYWDPGSRPDGPDAFLLGGVKPLAARLCMRASNALLWGSAIFFLLCGVRALVRYDWLAIAISSVLMTFVEGTVRNSSNLLVDVPVFILLYVGFALMLTRVGLIPAIVAIFALNTIGDTPIGDDFGAWFNWIPTVQIALIGGIAVYAFKRSQAAAPLRDALVGRRPTPRTAGTR